MIETVERGATDAGATVIWLHGLGADGYDFVPIVSELELPAEMKVRFVFPHADVRPVTLNQGMRMRAWYDIVALDLEDRSHDEVGIRSSAAQVDELIEREIEGGIPPDRIVLAGFSQGGALAMHVALRSRRRLAGLIALSCYVVLADAMQSERSEENRQLPVFAAHGSLDPVVPVEAGRRAAETLRGLGHSVEWHEYSMPHAVHPQEIVEVGKFLRRVLGP